jgi:hypothetical protein
MIQVQPTFDQPTAELVIAALEVLNPDDQEATEAARDAAAYVRDLLAKAVRCPYCAHGTTEGGCCRHCRERHRAMRLWAPHLLADHHCDRGPF